MNFLSLVLLPRVPDLSIKRPDSRPAPSLVLLLPVVGTSALDSLADSSTENDSADTVTVSPYSFIPFNLLNLPLLLTRPDLRAESRAARRIRSLDFSATRIRVLGF